jgi:hypothetical protein
MCDVVGSMGALGPETSLMTSQGLSPQQVASVTVDAVHVYCPEKSGLMPPLPGLPS